MNLDKNNNVLALDALMKANIDPQTKAELFRQSVFQLTPTAKTQTLSDLANHTLEDLKERLAASLQQKPLFYS